jgi:hypothetical protein
MLVLFFFFLRLLGFHQVIAHRIARGISVSVPDCPVDTAVHLG